MKDGRAPQQALENFQRERGQREKTAALAFNGCCLANRELWIEANRCFFRREKILATLKYAIDAN